MSLLIIKNRSKMVGVFVALIVLLFSFLASANYVSAATEQGSIGLEGKISSPPPTQAATITFPSNGTTTTEASITVTGLCPDGLLVKIFKNNVFSGSVQCSGGNYSIKIDLFSGLNELIARVYDDLDQPGPDSNKVRVTVPSVSNNIGAKISLTSSFAKRGANPGETLTWPISLAGGEGPYAVSVDWGDGKTADIISLQFPGNFNITHKYDTPGIYNIVIRATDKNGTVAFLQLVGVGNGQVGQSNVTGNGSSGSGTDAGQNNGTKAPVKILWQPAAISIPLIFSTFYLGRKYELFSLRKRLEARDDIR